MEDLIIVWLWWGWYTAWIYAFRYGLDPLIIWQMDWWLIIENAQVENFPWYPNPVSGYEIMENIKKQLLNYPARIVQDTVNTILPIDPSNFHKWYAVHTSMKWIIETKSIILAIWTKKRKLWVPWEQQFFWKWVSYCATCDWFFYRNKTVAVVWWWDSALIEAVYLSGICSKVYLIHRRNEFRAEPIRQQKVMSKENIEIITPAVINEIKWESKVNSIIVSLSMDSNNFAHAKEVQTQELFLDWIFIAVWTQPMQMSWLDEFLHRDEKWYIKVSTHKKTNLDWIFAAWDCTTWSWWFRQLITACWEWAVAAETAFKYLSHYN